MKIYFFNKTLEFVLINIKNPGNLIKHEKYINIATQLNKNMSTN